MACHDCEGYGLVCKVCWDPKPMCRCDEEDLDMELSPGDDQFVDCEECGGTGDD